MARETMINVKTTREERERWKTFAKSQGKPLGRIIREYLERRIARDGGKC